MGQHDLSYRLFFSHRLMIRDLLREIVGEGWVERVDLDSGELVNTSFVSDKHDNRESDVIWRFRRKDGHEPVFIYILMEFQSRPDPSMPVRLMGYVSLFYQSLMKSLPAEGWKRLPLVIPMVVYNGTGPWDVATDLGSLIGDLDPSAEIYRPRLRYLLVDEARYSREELAEMANPVAELFRIETSRDWAEVRTSVRRLRQTMPPDEEALRRAFLIWFQRVVLPRLGLSREEASEISTFEEVDTVLTESIDRWGREIREEALQEGLQKGLQEGLQKGIQKGRQQARQEGEARMLLRLLRLKFGPVAPEVEERVQATDADRLLEWSDRVLTAESLEEVLRD